MKFKIEIDRDQYDYRWSVDGNKYGTAYDKTTCYGFSDKALVEQGWEEVVAFNGSIFYTYNGATFAEGVEKSRGVNNQDLSMACVTNFNDSMAIGLDYDGNVIFDKQTNIMANLDAYYGAVTGCFGIYKDYSKWPLGSRENDSQFTTRSGRTVLGFDGKDYYIITQVGTTGSSGFTGADLYNECKGLKDAICFDGGGSVWCRYFGKYITTTPRKVKNAVILYRKKKEKSDKPESEDKVTVKKVIDISYYQGNVDYAKVKASGVEGVILRSSYTGYGDLKQHTDAKFEEYYKGFKAIGMPMGVYHYSSANTIELARREAAYVLDLIDGKELEYPVFFDTENQQRQKPLSKQELTDIVKAFCEVIEKAGYYVTIYASTSWFDDELDCSQLKDYDKWVAQYSSKCTFTEPYGMWQYSSTGKVDGISGNVDMNHCYRDYPTIIKNAKLNSFGKEPVVDYKTLYNEIKTKYNALLAEHEHCDKKIQNIENKADKLNEKLEKIKNIINEGK